jgi:hypothetical protein
VAEAFSAIPGVELVGVRRKTEGESEEIDLYFRNRALPDGLAFFPTNLLVECKNWSAKVGSAEVGWFSEKLENTPRSIGILIAAQGLTGDTETPRNAHWELAMSAAKGRTILVIDQEELEAAEYGESLAVALEEKRHNMEVLKKHVRADLDSLRAAPRDAGHDISTIHDALEEMRLEMLRGLLEQPRDAIEPGDAADAVEAAIGAVSEARAAVESEPKAMETWEALQHALSDLGMMGLRVVAGNGAWEGWPDDWIEVNVALHTPERLPSRVHSRLWDHLMTYLVDELREPHDRDPDDAAFTLIGLCTREMVYLDDLRWEVLGAASDPS